MTHGIIQYVAEHAALDADDLERQAAEMEAKARDFRATASVLRQLHDVALPHAKPGTFPAADERPLLVA